MLLTKLNNNYHNKLIVLTNKHTTIVKLLIPSTKKIKNLFLKTNI